MLDPLQDKTLCFLLAKGEEKPPSRGSSGATSAL